MFSKKYSQETLFATNVLAVFLTFLVLCVLSNGEGLFSANSTVNDGPAQPIKGVRPGQLNCTTNPRICDVVCNETKSLPWSSTFCDSQTGSCICDCRDTVPKDCQKTPFTPCFQDCVRKNPNPDVYLYEGVNCPYPQKNGTIDHQCACECTVRDDYEETNDI